MRIAMVLDRQTEAARQRIHDAILDGANEFKRAGGHELDASKNLPVEGPM